MREIADKIAEQYLYDLNSHPERDTGFVYHHGLRTAKIALKLREAIKEDDRIDDLIYVAGLFHDVGKVFPKHNEMGATITKDLLRNHCTEDELNYIYEMIYFHNQRKKQDDFPFYVKLIQDADLVDHFGSLDIWLGISYNRYRKQNLDQMIAFWTSKEYQNLLDKHRKLLNYDISIKIYEEKIDFAKSFIERFVKENRGELFVEL